MSTIAQDYLTQADAAIAAGDLDRADTLLKQAEMAQTAASLKAAETKAVEANRLPMVETPAAPAEPAVGHTKAIEYAYVKKFGAMDDGVRQIYRELYGSDNYALLRAAKMADTERYLRSGVADPRLMKQVLLAPEQVVAAIVSGVPVNDGQYTIKATMVEAQDTLGGYLVLEEVNQDMVQRLPGLTAVRPRARKFNTSRDALSFLVRTGGDKRYIGAVRSKQTSESPTSGSFDSNATFGKLIVPVHVNLSRVPVSKSLLEDSALNLMSEVLMPEFAAEAAVIEDQQFLTGTGANEPQGVLNGTAANGAPFNADVATRTSGNASALTFDGLVKMPWDIAGQYRSRKNTSTAFVFASATGLEIASAKDSTGAYLWTEMHGNNAIGSPDTLRGWAYAESEAMPSIAANTYPVIFGDWQGYRIVDRIGMSVQRYEDASTAATDSVVFFCRRRYGGQVAEGYRFVALKIAS